MQSTSINATGMSWAQAHLVEDAKRLLFVSGQVPVDAGDNVPQDFGAQCWLVWKNVEARLHAGGMTLANLVKVTVFLSDRCYREANARIRHEVLGPVSPALTVIITGIHDEAWLLEIEAVAAAWLWSLNRLFMERPGRCAFLPD